MKIIDRYVLRQFVKTFAICWISLTGLFVIVDAFSNLDEFMARAKQTQQPLLVILADYYLYRALAFFDGISAVLAMISAMFTLTGLQRHNELTAIMAAGVSRTRTARPVMAAAAVVTLLALVLRELILPQYREKLAEDTHTLKGGDLQPMRARVDLDTEVLFRGKYLDLANKLIHRPSFVLPPGLDTEGLNLAAEYAVYRPREGTRPAGYLFQSVSSPVELLKLPDRTRNDLVVIMTPVNHADFLRPDEVFLISKVEFDQLTTGDTARRFMSTAELIRGLRNSSLDYGADVRVTIHARIAQPMRDLTLLFLGLPLVLRRETKNIYAAIGLCGVLTFLFMGVTMAAEAAGGVLFIRPSLAAWVPLLVFVPTAVALCDRIDR
jgi:lipopolysaccharide export system permease protein